MEKRWYETLYENFENYDQEPYTQNTVREVDFIEAEMRGDRRLQLLDIGCGTGRHALELARRGYQVTGLDLSVGQIVQARRKAAAENLQVSFHVADARTLRYADDFDVALLLCEGGFSLMEDDEMDLAILCGAYDALRKGGLLVLNAPNAANLIAANPGETQFDLTTLRETFTLDPPDGAGPAMECSQRYYTCPELKLILEQVGFKQVAFFAVTGQGFERATAITRSQFEIGATARK